MDNISDQKLTGFSFEQKYFYLIGHIWNQIANKKKTKNEKSEIICSFYNPYIVFGSDLTCFQV